MKPYLAIVADAFREAFSSKVLYLLLLIIGTVLICLIPLSYIVKPAALLSMYDVADQENLAEMLVADVLPHLQAELNAVEDKKIQDLDAKELQKIVQNSIDATGTPRSLPAILFSRFSPESQRQIVTLYIYSQRGRGPFRLNRNAAILQSLNNLIQDQKLSDDPMLVAAATREKASGAAEVKELLAQDWEDLDEQQQRRLNRLLINAAVDKVMRPVEATSTSITYFGFEPADELPMDEDTLRSTLLTMIRYGLSWGVNGATALIGIIITAPMIPRMFESGSLALLLSKPLNRSGLFLMQFLSGGAFVLIIVVFLMTGLFVILGTRFGIWEYGLMGVIPVFMLAFGVYYSVSALAGLIWRNAIVSVIVTVVFWATCMMVNFANWSFDSFFQTPHRIGSIAPIQDKTFVRTEAATLSPSSTLSWNAEQRAWVPTFSSMRPSSYVGDPIYLGDFPESGDVVVDLAGDFVPPNMGMFGLPTKPIADRLDAGFEKNNFQRQGGPPVRLNPAALFPPMESTSNSATCHLLSAYGIYSITLTPDDFDPTNTNVVQPKLISTSMGLQDPIAGDQDADTKSVVVFSNGRLALFRYDKVGVEVLASSGGPGLSGVMQDITNVDLEQLRKEITNISQDRLRRIHYVKVAEVVISDAKSLDAEVAIGGGHIVVALSDGRILLLDEQLKTVQHYKPLNAAPKAIHVSPAGDEFAIVMKDRSAYMIYPKQKKATAFPVGSSTDVLAVAYDDQGRLYVASNTDQVRIYEKGLEVEEFAPAYTSVRYGYEYVVQPLYYYILPRVWKFEYALWETVSSDKEERDKSTAVANPYAAVIHAIFFVAVIVGCCCLYMELRDF